MNIEHQTSMNIDFRFRNGKKKKRKKIVTSINIDDFPIAIDNDFLSITIDCYRSVNW